MPRPPVRAEDRKRSTRACIACRATKKRCDAVQPCKPCVNRGIGVSCTYSQHVRTRRTTHQSHPHSQQDSLTGSDTQRHDRISPLLRQHEEAVSNDRDGPRGSITLQKTKTPSGPRPVMMYTCSGEKVFVGNASAIAFLQYLRGSLNILGPGFAISHGCHRMFEAQVPVQQPGIFKDDIDDGERRILVQRFLDASSGLLDLFDESEIDRLLAMVKSPQNSLGQDNSAVDSDGLLCLYMMIAVGAQCRGQPGDSPKAFRYFSEARRLSFQGMLSDPTLDTARGFVLMAFYMFGACRRNSAFMYLGVATKAASVMGLHMAHQFQSLSEDERSLRSRIDSSIRLFDVVCSSILGRPTSIAPCRPRENSTMTSTRHRNQTVDAACAFAAILNRIVDKLTEESQLGLIRAERFLDEIRDWSKSLPPALRQRPRKGSAQSHRSHSREIVIGNIHVACTYYFGISLTTREFLIQHIMSQLDTEMSSSDSRHVDITSEEEKRIAELSNVCVDSAVFMAEMCSDALDSRTIMGNMCILKAWLFAAGLILGFSLLDPDAPQSRGRAFHNALRVLDFLGHLSPQAAQYHRLLMSFSQAIDAFKNNSPSDHNQSAPYVEQLLSLNMVESPEAVKADETSRQSNGFGDGNNDGQSSFFQSAAAGGVLNSLSAFDFAGTGGEDLILSLLWDGGDDPYPVAGSSNMSLDLE